MKARQRHPWPPDKVRPVHKGPALRTCRLSQDHQHGLLARGSLTDQRSRTADRYWRRPWESDALFWRGPARYRDFGSLPRHGDIPWLQGSYRVGRGDAMTRLPTLVVTVWSTLRLLDLIEQSVEVR